MNRKIIIAALLVASALTAQAQSYTEHVQEPRTGQGTVKIEQSAEIDQLVNNSSPAPVATTMETAKKPAATKDTTPKHTAATKPAETVSDAETPVAPETAVDNSRKVMRGKKVAGYRVQVFSGGNTRDDKNKAQRAGNAMKEAFPTQPVFVHFYSPRWVCRIGNFVERSEADECLKQVRALGYSQACIVKGTITVK